MATTKIEWTQKAWNLLTGCTKISPGCQNRYVAQMAKRLKAMGQVNYRNGFELTLHEHALEIPLRWKKPCMVFLNSMPDFFHKDVPLDFILRVFDVMREAEKHIFQVLTKRGDRLLEINQEIYWPGNVWMGVTVENDDYMHRIDCLRSTGAQVKIRSLEPLQGPLVNLNLRGIDWVIVGGESGPGVRPVEGSWVINIRDQCFAAGVPFFFKSGAVSLDPSLEGRN